MHEWLERLEGRTLLSSASFPLPAPPNWPGGKGGEWFLTAGPRDSLWASDGVYARIIKVGLNGAMTQYQVPNAGQAALMSAGPGGSLWFYDDFNNCFGKLTPNGKVREFTVPDFLSEQVIVTSMSEGPKKLIWFSGGNEASFVMGTISKRGVVKEWAPIDGQTNFGAFLTLASDGSLWSDASLHGDAPDSFVRFTPDGRRQILHAYQNSVAGLAAGVKGSIWSVDEGSTTAYHYFSDGHAESFNIQVSASDVLPARDGGVWFLYDTPDNLNFNGLGRISPSGKVYEIAVPEQYDVMATGPDGNLWGLSGLLGLDPVAATRFDPKTAISLHPNNITMASGAPRTYKLAIISNAPRKANPSEFTATVDWGDGTTGNAVVIRRGSELVVSAVHDYVAGNFGATLTVNYGSATVMSESAINALLPPSGSD